MKKYFVFIILFLCFYNPLCLIAKGSTTILTDSSEKLKLVDSSDIVNSYLNKKDTLMIILKSDKDPLYLKYILPAICTLIVGIISFLLSQLYLRHLDKKRARGKYIGILKVLSEEIKRNLDLECQLHAYLYVRIIPTFGLSFFITDKIFSELTAVCLNYDLLKKIFHKYFEYRHIQNRLDKTSQRGTELEEAKKEGNTLALIYASSLYASEREGTILLIKGNIKGSYELYNEIIREIKSLDKTVKLKELSATYLQEKYDEFQNNPDVLNAAKESKWDIGKREKFYS